MHKPPTPEEISIYRDHVRSNETKEKITWLLQNPEDAKQPDDDMRNPWAEYRSILQGEISRFDAIGLQLTSFLLQTGIIDVPPLPEIKNLVQQFLENAMGNNKLNSFLYQDNMQYLDVSKYYVTNYAIDTIAYFSFKTRNFDKGERVLQKLDKIQESLLSGNPIPKKYKISLKEFAVISDLADVSSIMEELNKEGFISGNEKLENLYAISIKAKQILGYLEQENNKELKKLGSGVLILDNTNKAYDAHGMALGLSDRINNLFTAHGHASMLHFTKNNELKLSELTPRFSVEEGFHLIQQLYADMYKIDVISLIPEEHHRLLHQVYGEDWQAKIVAKFKTIENEIYTNGHTKFSGLQAGISTVEQVAGLASIIPFGHKQLTPNDFEELHNNVMAEKYTQETSMMCSQFCAIAIATCLVELNKQIKEDIKKSSLADNIKVNELNIVKIPFGKHDNLNTMHPDRLLEVLKSYNCIKPVQAKSTEYIKEASVEITKTAKKYIVNTTQAVQQQANNYLKAKERTTTIKSRL